MPFTGADAELFLCDNPALNLTTTLVGGDIGAVQILNSSVGEVHFSVTPEPVSGVIVAHNKFFVYNSSAFSAWNCFIWIDNSLDDCPALATVTVRSTSADDNSSFKCRVSGFASGASVQADVIMNGLTGVVSGTQFDIITTVEFFTIGNVRANPAGDVSVESGATLIGILPAGIPNAQSIVSIGIEASLNSSDTITDTTTPPVPALSRPNTFANALPFCVTEIPTLTAQGVWSRLRLPAMTKSVSSDTVSLMFQGNDSA